MVQSHQVKDHQNNTDSLPIKVGGSGVRKSEAANQRTAFGHLLTKSITTSIHSHLAGVPQPGSMYSHKNTLKCATIFLRNADYDAGNTFIS